MSISFDSLIIIIVVVSSSIIIGVIAALCWMWRILRKDRRSARLQGPYGWTVVPHWPTEVRGATDQVSPSVVETPDERVPLTNEATPPVIVPVRRESLYLRSASAPTWEEVTLNEPQHSVPHLQFATDDCEAPPPYAEK